jgi:hypothetical protein
VNLRALELPSPLSAEALAALVGAAGGRLRRVVLGAGGRGGALGGAGVLEAGGWAVCARGAGAWAGAGGAAQGLTTFVRARREGGASFGGR